MSEPSRHGPSTPMSERPPQNKLAIRVVPYSPPRPESQQDERRESQASRVQADCSSGSHDGDAGGGTAATARGDAQEHGHIYRHDGKDCGQGSQGGTNPGRPGSALSSALSPASSHPVSAALAGKAKDARVSGTNPYRTVGYGYGSGQYGQYGQPLTTSQPGPGPAQRPSSQGPSTWSIPSESPGIPDTSSTFNAPQPSPSTTSTSSSTRSSVAAPRPISRRRNQVTINADKTFTIVRSAPQTQPQLQLQPQPRVRSRPQLESSESASDVDTWRSPLLPCASRTPTTGTITSTTTTATTTYGRPSTSAWTDDHLSSPSSPVTGATTPTLDRYGYSQADPSLYTPSPGSPSGHSPYFFQPHDAAAAPPENYYMVGGLRKVPPARQHLRHQASSATVTPAGAAETQPAGPAPPPGIAVYHARDRDQDQDQQQDRGHDEEEEEEEDDDDDDDEDHYEDAQDGQAQDFHHLPFPQESSKKSDSAHTPSTASDTTNYKVYRQGASGESTDSLAPPPPAQSKQPSQSNWERVASSSAPESPTTDSEGKGATADSPTGSVESRESYVVYGESSPSPSASVVALAELPRPSYSRPLPVPPRNPATTRDHPQEEPAQSESIREQHRGHTRHSRQESQQSTQGSVSFRSITSFASEDSQHPAQAAQAVYVNTVNTVNPVVVHLVGPRGSAIAAGTRQEQNPWSTSQAAESSSGSTLAPPNTSPVPRRPEMVESYPHQWSSQLSTVPSVSEEESESCSSPMILSRSVSASGSGVGSGSGFGIGSGTREQGQGQGPWRDSAGWASPNNRHVMSISSSLATQLEENSTSTSAGSIASPRMAYSRSGLTQTRTVRDQDEHGDGLADLDHRPSRTGLSALFSSSNSSSRNLHSSAGSITPAIPTWAKLYYGSGERKFLRPTSISTFSEAGDSSRPGSAYLRGSASDSPDTDHFPLSIYSPRRRPRESGLRGEHRLPEASHLLPSTSRSLLHTPSRPDDTAYLEPITSHRGVLHTIRKKTSSIWSPHLRRDRRASGYSVWDPPTISWTADGGIRGRRNMQVVLFTLGFVLPVTWMVAAFLPLPSDPNAREKLVDGGEGDDEADTDTDGRPRERHTDPASLSQSHFSRHPEMVHRLEAIEEARYESARWWRNLNRIMTVVGLLIIALVIALVIIGLKQGWIVTTASNPTHL